MWVLIFRDSNDAMYLMLFFGGVHVVWCLMLIFGNSNDARSLILVFGCVDAVWCLVLIFCDSNVARYLMLVFGGVNEVLVYKFKRIVGNIIFVINSKDCKTLNKGC